MAIQGLLAPGVSEAIQGMGQGRGAEQAPTKSDGTFDVIRSVVQTYTRNGLPGPISRGAWFVSLRNRNSYKNWLPGLIQQDVSWYLNQRDGRVAPSPPPSPPCLFGYLSICVCLYLR